MIDLSVLCILIVMHFFADFVLQSDSVAKNKSRKNRVLLWHVTLYSLPFLYFGWLFALVNFILHFVTDYISSKITKKLWAQKQTHWFFVTIGFDQMIHLLCLVTTYVWLVG